MKADKLKKGMTFKNWKELCEFLGIDSKGGNIKKANEKELSRFCEWHKEGQKIIIDKKYRTPKNKKENRGRREGSENPMSIDYILSRMIIKDTIESEGKCSQRTTMGWLREFGLVKEEFKENKNTLFDKKTSNDDEKYLYEIDEFVEDFIDIEYDSLEEHIKNAMMKVDKFSHFMVYKFPVLTYRKWDEETDRWVIVNSMTLKTAKEIQELQMKRCEIITSLGGDGEKTEFQWVFGKYQNLGKYREFKKQWNEYLYETYKMNSMYDTWSVITKSPTENNIRKIKDKFAEDFKNINNIYSIIYNKRLKSAEKRQNKFYKIKGEGKFIDKSRELWKITHDLFICDKVTQSKIEGKYVEIWKELFKELMF